MITLQGHQSLKKMIMIDMQILKIILMILSHFIKKEELSLLPKASMELKAQKT